MKQFDIKTINTGTIESGRVLTKKLLILAVFFGTLPMWISTVGLYEYIGIEILIWCIYAMGYNILLGYTGLNSMGQGAFFGTGAYAMAIYQIHMSGTNIWLGLLFSILFGIIAGGFVGLFVAKRRGVYFALITIAFGQIFYFASLKLYKITGGEDGLLNLRRLPVKLPFAEISINKNIQLYYFIFIILLAVIFLIWRLIRSPFGSVIQAINQNEDRSKYIGYNVKLFKWLSFTITAAISAFAGGLMALAQQSAYPDTMNLQWSGVIVMIVIIGGGFVSFWGPIIGVVFYFIARDVIGGITSTWMLWFGLAFMAIIAFKPEGLSGIISDIAVKITKKSKIKKQVN